MGLVPLPERKTIISISLSLYLLKIYGEDISLETRKKAFTRMQPYRDLDLGIPNSRMVRNTCLLFKPPSL